MSDANTPSAPEVVSPSVPPAPPNRTPAAGTSHTQAHPTLPPHTLTNRSTLASPEPFIRLFLLAWAIRYVPRGFFGELFERNTGSFIKKPINKFIDWSVVDRMESKINSVLAKDTAFVRKAKADITTLRDTEAGHNFYDKLKPIIHRWRGDASKEIEHIVERAKEVNGKPVVSPSSKASLRNLIRGKLDDIGYSLSLFVGSSALSLNYSRLVRSDIQNLFRETVALEQDKPQEKITFADIAHSDNRIINGTVSNYRGKLLERLGSDSLFLLTTPLKSMHVTDFLLGVKGVQMFRDTWRRTPTLFEDLVTFVNNKINPTNGLGQPISIGEVFDLYQHYAQAYTPDRAFTGVIEHAKIEGVLWAGNQPIFQRMTELMNKTYAYKHQSILDNTTGQTVLQADFPLPKFIYLLGHDLIDVHNPKQTLATIEIANSHGIAAVKEMGAMLKQGKSLDDVIAHYQVKLPKIETAPQPEIENGVLNKSPQLQLDQVTDKPATHIDAGSITQAKHPAEKSLAL